VEKLYKKLYNLNSSPSVIRTIKWRIMRWGVCITNGEKMSAYGSLMGNPKGKKLLGRPRRRWVDNIKIDLDCISLAQDRDKGEPSGSIKCCESIEWLHNWWSFKQCSAP
jgi:hypothetical protein